MKKPILVDLILFSLFLKQFRLGASTVSWSKLLHEILLLFSAVTTWCALTASTYTTICVDQNASFSSLAIFSLDGLCFSDHQLSRATDEWQSTRIHLADMATISQTSCCQFLDYVFMDVQCGFNVYVSSMILSRDSGNSS